MLNKRELTCEERVGENLDGRIDDLRQLWKAYCADTEGEGNVEDLGNIFDYGFNFDYVTPNTFGAQREGYFRYQLSWGGPSDEFRFFVNPGFSLHRIEYWFLDWYDGAKRVLGECTPAGDLMRELFEWISDSGVLLTEYEKATEE